MRHHFVQTSVLNIAYEAQGPPDGQPVILLHGFPDDVRAWDQVVMAIIDEGYRTFTPYLRGYGPTRFRFEDTLRSGQNGALMQDIVEFADALELEQFVLVGHDWGAQAAQALAALHPARVRQLVSLAPYSLTWSDYQEGPPHYAQLRALWYQGVLNQEMGEGLLHGDRRGFCRYLWQTWSPTWDFAAGDFATTAASFDNPDFVAVVLHAYRSSYGRATEDPRYAVIEAQLVQRPPITVPTTVLLGKADGINLFQPAMLAQHRDFIGNYVAHGYGGVGHFLHREAPEAVVAAIRAGG